MDEMNRAVAAPNANVQQLPRTGPFFVGLLNMDQLVYRYSLVESRLNTLETPGWTP